MKKSIVTLIIITLLIYNIIPIINATFPNSIYYTFLTDLWIINSLYALISSITFIGAGYVLSNKGQVNAGYAVIPRLFCAIFSQLAVNEKFKKEKMNSKL